MFTKDFINQVFVTEVEQMTIDKNGLATHPYIGFSLICQLIEVIGACFDEYDWENRNLSELRFRLAITKLFPEKYKEYNNNKSRFDLYKNLRCPMVHQMRPSKYIGLSERKHEVKAGIKNAHLSMQGGMLLLIYEDFLADFKNASLLLIKMIENNHLSSKKVYDHNLSIPSDNPTL